MSVSNYLPPAVILQLKQLGLVAFVADGSILPRKGGDVDTPMEASKAVPFTSPPSLAVTVTLPHEGAVRGMGIPAGVPERPRSCVATSLT